MAESASPYRLDRYVLDTLMRDLVGHDRRPSCFLVYLSLAAAGRAAFSHAQLAERTGLSKRAVQDAVAHLLRRGLIAAYRKAATDAAQYRCLTPWQRRSR